MMAQQRLLFPEQPSPDPSKLARRNDPETSHEAAESADGLTARAEVIIADVMSGTGRPMAAEEIAERCSLSPVQVNRRLSGMEGKGLIDRTDQTHVTYSGRRAMRWRLVACEGLR